MTILSTFGSFLEKRRGAKESNDSISGSISNIQRNIDRRLGSIDEQLKLIGQKLSVLNTAVEKIRNDQNVAINEIEFIRNRLSSYLGDGVALARLDDQSPIYVNSDDFGPAANILNGGQYETENIEILMSFVRPETIFLDIGANIGIFSLKIARRVPNGKVYAFEPQLNLARLLVRSAYLNGFGGGDQAGGIKCFSLGAYDRNGDIGFHVFEGDGGGGRVLDDASAPKIKVARLDDLLGPSFRCDLVKIDVEGHELAALKGMDQIIARSAGIKVLFEKLGANQGTEDRLEQFFHERGFSIYGVAPNSTLKPLEKGALARWDGYAFAARADDRDMTDLFRGRFSIYPSQLYMGAGGAIENGRIEVSATMGQILFHGPYWYLRRGQYRLIIHGAVKGAIEMTVAARFGYPLTSFSIPDGANQGAFIIERDAFIFECVARAASATASVSVERVEIIRI